MKIVTSNAANANSAEIFIPAPVDPDGTIAADFALCSSETSDTYLRPLNSAAHQWLLKNGRGKWIHGRLLLPKYRPCWTTVEAMNSRFTVSWSGLALPPERPQFTLVN